MGLALGGGEEGEKESLTALFFVSLPDMAASGMSSERF